MTLCELKSVTRSRSIIMTHFDERIARSPVQRDGSNALASPTPAFRVIDDELDQLEDLVLHDATKDIRTPSHELTIARDVLPTRRPLAR